MDKFAEDFCVIIFDMHPDLDSTFPKFSCGSWVNLITPKTAIKKIVMIGPSSEDLSFPHNMTFNFSYFKDGRVELYPFYHKPSITAFGRIVWDNLRDKNIKQFMAGTIDRLPSKNVYISIDKDCLKRDYAVTNWEEGPVTLDWLLEALGVLRDNANIIGMDITGDYSPIKADSVIKKICTALDHPRQAAREMDMEKINRINEDTNMKILELFLL
jgi:arginase family enzyme